MTDVEGAFQVIDRSFDGSVRKLLDLVAVPSVSSEAEGGPGITAAAKWLQDELSAMGLAAEIVQTAGHPVVLAQSKETVSGRPRLLFYGHYDVQPAGDREQWTHPPFSPCIVAEEGLNRIYGRGASDSKSQLWTFIEALRAWKEAQGEFPANIVVMLEGEEESGSASLPEFIGAHCHALRCDAAFICDAEMWSPTQPAITTQIKGLIHERVTIVTPHADLHSGHYGAVAANPIRIMSAIIASLHDEKGRVAIDGFYDNVEPIPNELRQQWAELALQMDPSSGVDLDGGVTEDGFSTLEAMWGRPAIDINGITGGHQGPSERSVLPGQATARISFRLVAGQRPEVVRAQFRAYVTARIPTGCRVEFVGDGGSSAVALPQDNPFLLAAARGLEAEWKTPTILRGTGGAIPVVEQLTEALGATCVLIGFILPDDAIHAPDERYDTERLLKGMRSWVRIFAELQPGS